MSYRCEAVRNFNVNASKRSVAKIICLLLAASYWLAWGASAYAHNASQLLQTYCMDCHGAQDEFPEGDFSLAFDFDSASINEVGPALKKALDAIEGFEMPPRDAEQPSTEEREQLVSQIRSWLGRPALGANQDPGHAILRRLTRLEYNNTVRDLLGLETDLFMISERLPFSRGHYQPQTGSMPKQLRMSAREYGAKYPVLLPNDSLPGDSRAEYGFTNRGDAQNLSAVQLEQYVKLAGQIAFHPELLSRGQRMQELFPGANWVPQAMARTVEQSPLATSGNQIASNQNVLVTADGSDWTLEEFRQRIASAFAEDRGFVFSGEELKNSTVAGKGGLLRIAYGKTAQRVLAINPNEDLWIAPFGSAEESSGDTLLANHKKKVRKLELTFQPSAAGVRFAGVDELGLVILSRRDEEGAVIVKVTLDDGSERELAVSLTPGAGTSNTFVSFAAGNERTIKRVLIDGSGFSGDYVLFDDLAIITGDPPNDQPLVQVEEPVPADTEELPQRDAQINREIANLSPAERIEHLLFRSFRRDIKAVEIESYLELYQAEIGKSGSDELAMRTVLQAVLASPSFLYVNYAPTRSNGEVPANEHPLVTALDDYALASRLSYFLWSSMPDDQLLKLAKEGRLNEESVLEAQVQRMLDDPRSIELAENFFVSWMRLQELWSAQPDPRQFREFYSGPQGKRTLAQDMFAEVLLLFQTILVEDRPITELLDADYSYINGQLAKLYGKKSSEFMVVDQATSPIFERVVDEATSPIERGASSGTDSLPRPLRNGTDSLPRPLPNGALDDDRNWYRIRNWATYRGGIVTSPAVLTLTSFPHRTSSIRRGVWLLDTLFNRHPPAPRVAVADIDEQPGVEELTLRERVELHRENSACAVCHDRIDPPGFALENFDAIGRWRDADGEHPIDASGELAGIGKFKNAIEFKALLASQKRRFVQGFTEHLLSYALGRKLEYYDAAAVEAIVEKTVANDYRLSTLITETVKSYPFCHTKLDHE